MNHSSQSGRSRWIYLVLVLVGFRMWLVAGDEIMLHTNDSERYAMMAEKYPSREFGLPSHLPGLAMTSKLATSFGIPYKMFLDLFAAIIFGLVSIQFYRWTHSRILSGLVLVSLLFNPWLINQSRVFMAESLVAILFLGLIVAGAQFILTTPDQWRWRWALLYTTVSVYVVLVRPELELLMFYNLLFSALVLSLHRKHFKRLFAPISVAALLLPIVMPWLATASLSYFHRVRFGVEGAHISDANGLNALMDALYQIDPDEKKRYIPVPMESLKKACQVSPTMNRYKSRLLNLQAPNFLSAKRQHGNENEVGAWLNWHLIWVFSNNQESYQAMAKAADEIQQAFSDGKLKKRTASFPIDPQYEQWIPDLWPLFKKSIAYSSFPPVHRHQTVPDLKELPALSVRSFDEAVLRRNGNSTNPCYYFQVTYWRDSNPNQSTACQKISIVDSNDKELVSGPVILSKRGNRDFWEIRFPAIGYARDDKLRLRFEDDQGRHFWVPVELRYRPQFFVSIKFSPEVKPENWAIFVDTAGRQFETRESLHQKIVAGYSIWLAIALFVSFVAGGFSRPRCSIRTGLTLLTAIGLLIVGRCAMYTLLEAWMKWGLARYIGPNQVLVVVFAIGTAFWLGTLLRFFYQRYLGKTDQAFVTNGPIGATKSVETP